MSSTPIVLGIDDFETGLQGWSYGNIVTDDFGNSLELRVSGGWPSAASISSVKDIIGYLGTTPKYATIYARVVTTINCGPCAAYIDFLDNNNNVISTITLLYNPATGRYIIVIEIPQNTRYIRIRFYLVSSATGYGADFLVRFDNIFYLSEASYVVRSFAVTKYTSPTVNTIPLNLSGFPMMFSIQRLGNPPANTSISSESVSYTDPSNASRTTSPTLNRIDANSIVSLRFTLSTSVSTRITGTVRYIMPIYRRDNGYLLGLVLIYVDINANPTQPYEVSFSIPNPAFNYNTSKSVELVIVAPNLNRTTYGVKASLSCSGNCANIVSATVTVEYRDIYDNVIDSDTATITGGSISDFTKTVNLDVGATYTVVVSITITAAVTATTYLTVTLIFTAQ